MNTLIKKEIRLLLPAWIGAMLLAIVPLWIIQYFGDAGAVNKFPPLFFIMLGMLFLGITSFGNEISFNTFPLLLSQPVPRQRIWRVKISMLGLAFLSILAASIISWLLLALCHPANFLFFSNAFGGAELWIFVFAFASGGLWATLLLRQTIGAFWVALFAPVAISMVTNVISLPWPISDQRMDTIISVVCVCYAIAGFFYARHLFIRAQDTQWLESVFSLTWRKNDSEQAASSVSRGRRHWLSALVFKEIQLHQVNILFAVVVLVLHLSALLIRKIHPHFEDYYIKYILDEVWGLWLLIPLLIGCSAFAEERKLGVMESQLCLPVSRRAQIFTKFFVALVLSLFLGGLMPSLIEHTEIGAFLIFKIAAAIFFISFYASSLSRTTIQAIGLAMIVGAIMDALRTGFTSVSLAVASRSFIAQYQNEGYSLLTWCLGSLILLLALEWLTLWNFKWLHPGALLWRRNIMTILAALGFAFILIDGIYFRAWELLEPLQPPPGPVRLANPSPVKFSLAANRLYATLPDGRLWQGPLYQFYYSDRSVLRFTVPAGGPGEFIGGSNWMAFAEDEYQGVGIHSDGSLWSLQRKWDTMRDQWHQTGLFTTTQIGQDTNWSQVASGSVGFWLLKKDGSLWIWGTNSYDWHRGSVAIPQKLKLDLATAPGRIGGETNWVELAPAKNSSPYARQNNGKVWHWAGREYDDGAHYSYALVQNTNVDSQWLSFALYADATSFVEVKTNGELWLFRAPGGESKKATQLDKNHAWKTAGFVKWANVMAIREDGTLWAWPSSLWDAEISEPVQLGQQSDWIALARGEEIGFALAADGDVWAWGAPSGHEWLAPSRRPIYMGNIFQGASESP